MLNQQGFDQWADGYDRAVAQSEAENRYPFAGYGQVLKTIFDIVTRRPRPAVLDLGFGTGTLTAALYDRGCEICGQDFSAQMLALAREKMPDARLYQGDFAKGLAAPLGARTYDFIVATYSLHHLPDGEKVRLLRSLRPLLRAGGAILIGDVAFAARTELEACRAAAGDSWDADEIYFVADELQAQLPGLEFRPCSPCAGVLCWRKEAA